MAKKKMDAEELKEFKRGKYMGGPAEEKAEKKKKSKGKRMAFGGLGGTNTNEPAGPRGFGGSSNGGVSGGMNGGGRGYGGPAGGVRTGTQTGTEARNPVARPEPGLGRRGRGMGQPPAMRPSVMPKAPMPAAMPMPTQRPGLSFNYDTPMPEGMAPGNYMRNPTQKPAGAVTRGGMRGGGLAKKGVGQALAKGGLVKGAGCASRGVKKPRMV